MDVNTISLFPNAIAMLIPLIIYFSLIGLSIYTMILIIKALRIYIKKNS